jgi:cytochrome c-type biogenesis protein CcmF
MYESSYTHITLGVGQTSHVGEYTLKLNGFREVNGNGKFDVVAYVSVYKDGKFIGVMHPKLEIYNIINNYKVVASVDIISMPLQDIYIAMGGVTETGIASFQFYVVPLISFVWAGSILIITGGVLAALPYTRKGEIDAEGEG